MELDVESRLEVPSGQNRNNFQRGVGSGALRGETLAFAQGTVGKPMPAQTWISATGSWQNAVRT